jgi:high-affinity Fe2+/Pb2+ permease
MTMYETLDLAQSAFGNALAVYAVFLSIVSGYLITSYMVGSELSRIQVRLLTLLFLIVVSMLIWLISAFAYWGDVWAIMVRPEGVERSAMSPQAWTSTFMAVFNSLTVVACLVFMWTTRHAKRTDGT